MWQSGLNLIGKKGFVNTIIYKNDNPDNPVPHSEDAEINKWLTHWLSDNVTYWAVLKRRKNLDFPPNDIQNFIENHFYLSE